MNRVEKTFLGSGIFAGALIVVGIVLLIVTRELPNLLPILGGLYVGVATFLDYRQFKKMTVVVYRVRLVSANRGNFLTENYYFSWGQPDGSTITIFVEGKPKLTDEKGKKLKEGYLYDLTYLTPDGYVEDYNRPFAVFQVNGIAQKE